MTRQERDRLPPDAVTIQRHGRPCCVVCEGALVLKLVEPLLRTGVLK